LFSGVSLSEVQETNKKVKSILVNSGNILYPLFEHIRVFEVVFRLGSFSSQSRTKPLWTTVCGALVRLAKIIIIFKETKKIGRKVKKSSELLDKQFRLLQNLGNERRKPKADFIVQ